MRPDQEMTGLVSPPHGNTFRANRFPHTFLRRPLRLGQESRQLRSRIAPDPLTIWKQHPVLISGITTTHRRLELLRPPRRQHTHQSLTG